MKFLKFILPLFLTIAQVSCDTSNTGKVEEIVVIGGGLMGSSAAWQLAKQGTSVILIEKQDSVYTEGSSLGVARIARSNNRGNDIWSYMHNRSVQETQDLIDFLNSDNSGKKYDLQEVYTTSPVTYVGKISIYDRLMVSLKRQNIDYDIATTPEEGLELLDVILPDSVLIQREYNQHSGTMNPEVLIALLREGMSRKGGQILFNKAVISISFNLEKGVYKIGIRDEHTGESSELLTKKIVSAAGPYTGVLLKDIAPYFSEIINPQRVFLAFLKIKKEAYNLLTKEQKQKLIQYYPVINSSTGTRDGSFFSMIEYYDGDDHPIIKIGGHFQRSQIHDLNEVWSLPVTEEEKKWSLESTLRYFNLLRLPIEEKDIDVINGYSCVYSLTESEVPFVTPIIGDDDVPNYNFIVMAGMSGVGAKGALTYGLMAADLANQNPMNDSLYKSTADHFGYERLISNVRTLEK